MRLIDADALRESALKATGNSEFAFDNCFPYWQFSKCISEAPTIDAEPMRHGEWIQKKTAIGKTYSVCSRCNTDFKFKTDKGTFARLDMDGMNYCPNCGAMIMAGN